MKIRPSLSDISPECDVTGPEAIAQYERSLPPDQMTALERRLTAKVAELELLLHNNQVRREEVEDHHGELLRQLAQVTAERDQMRAVVEAARNLMNAAITGDMLLISTSNGNIYTELQADLAIAIRNLDQARVPDQHQVDK
jgi:hypothetical protein